MDSVGLSHIDHFLSAWNQKKSCLKVIFLHFSSSLFRSKLFFFLIFIFVFFFLKDIFLNVSFFRLFPVIFLHFYFLAFFPQSYFSSFFFRLFSLKVIFLLHFSFRLFFLKLSKRRSRSTATISPHKTFCWNGNDVSFEEFIKAAIVDPKFRDSLWQLKKKRDGVRMNKIPAI